MQLCNRKKLILKLKNKCSLIRILKEEKSSASLPRKIVNIQQFVPKVAIIKIVAISMSILLTFSPSSRSVALPEAPSGHHLHVLEAAGRPLLLGAGYPHVGRALGQAQPHCGHHCEMY